LLQTVRRLLGLKKVNDNRLLERGVKQLQTVLIIDDDPLFTDEVAFFFKSNFSGVTTLQANHESDAIRLAKKETVNLVLINVFMTNAPLKRGDGIVEEIRRYRPKSKIVITSYIDGKGYHATSREKEIAKRIKLLDFDHFMFKPVIPQKLVTVVERIFDDAITKRNEE